MKILMLFFVIVICSGCASNVRVTLLSYPPGATVFINGMSEGITPVTLYYTPTEEAKKRGYINIQAAKAHWPSGAKSETELSRIPTDNREFKYTFIRPNVPGVEIDLLANNQQQQLELQKRQQFQRDFELYQQQSLQQQQYQQQQYQEQIINRQNMNSLQQQLNQQRTKNPSNCTTIIFRNELQTTCY